MRQLSLTGVLTALAGSPCSSWVVRQVGVAQIERRLSSGRLGPRRDHRDRRPAVSGARARLAAVPRAAAHACASTTRSPRSSAATRSATSRRWVRSSASRQRRRSCAAGFRSAPAATALAIENVLLHALGGRDDRRRHGGAALRVPAAAGLRRVGEVDDCRERRPVRDRALAAVAAAGARQPRALGLAPAVARRSACDGSRIRFTGSSSGTDRRRPAVDARRKPASTRWASRKST